MTTRDAGRIPRAHGGDARRPPVHRADLTIEAWGPTREVCVAEAVRALVDSFVGRTLPLTSSTASLEVNGGNDADLLVAVLGEVIRRIRTRNEIPIATDVTATPTGLRLRCTVIDIGAVLPAGSLPKAVSRPRARCEHRTDGWWCSVRIDV